MKKALPVMETFLSLQGEGFHQGRLAYFLRLAGCDVGCPWCDVKESWSVSKEQWVGIDQVVSEIIKSPAEIVIITGGEPLMYDLSALTKELGKQGKRVHLETSGTYPLTGKFDWITLSPKKFKKPDNKIYKMADELKVVVAARKDLEWAEEESVKVNKDCLLYLQAEWDRKEKCYPLISSYILLNPKWKVSLQAHKYLGLR